MCTFYDFQVKELYKTEPCPDIYHRISRNEPSSCPADKQPLVSWTHVADPLIVQLYSFGVAEPLNKLRLIGIRNGSATLVLNLFSSSPQLITFLLLALAWPKCHSFYLPLFWLDLITKCFKRELSGGHVANHNSTPETQCLQEAPRECCFHVSFSSKSLSNPSDVSFSHLGPLSVEQNLVLERTSTYPSDLAPSQRLY